MNAQDKISLRFKPDDGQADPSAAQGAPLEKHELGTSSLYGRTERNITFRQRGSHDEARFDNAFPGAYFDILRSAFRMIAMFFGKK